MYSFLQKIAQLSPLLAVCVLPASLFALDPTRLIPQFHHTRWTSRDGAPSQIVALTQTADGFLWIGTSRGLFRFDGIKFEKYAPRSGTEIPSDNIYSLKADDSGGLWVSFRPSGLGYIKDGRIEIFNRKEQLPSSQIYVLGIDGKERVWAGTHNGLALRREDGTWDDVGEEWGFFPQRVRDILTDRRGRMWIALDNTIVMLPRDADRFEQTGEQVSSVTSLAESPDGRVWRSEYLGFARPVSHPSNPGIGFGAKGSRMISGIHFDRDGGLWFGDDIGIKRVPNAQGLNSDISEINDTRIETFETADNPPGPFLEDREGNIWIGSPKGLHRFRYSCFIPHQASGRYRNMTLSADAESGIWVASSLNLPLAHFEGEKGKTFSSASYISSLYKDANGFVWWGRHANLLRQTGEQITAFPQPKDLKEDWIWEVFKSGSDDFLWVSMGDDGLVSFENGKWGTRPKPAGLPDRGPSASFTENPGRIWLGYTEDRVAIFENGSGNLFTSADGIDVGRVRVIRKGSDRIWIGGERGLAVFDGTRFHTINTELSDRFGTVSGIVFSRDGALWLNEVEGIVRIAKEEIDRAIQDPAHRINFRRFDFEDGLSGSPQMNWTVSTAVESTDGRLWFATDGGLVSTDPLELKQNKLPPPVSIKGLAVQEEKYDIHGPLELPKGTEELSIEYTALSLSIPERVEFRYMLEGVDTNWHEAHSRREAFYTNLGPGEYRFRVIASNNDGVWNNEGAVLSFKILPRFYQTGWFVALLILCAAAIAVLIFKWRLDLVKNRMKLQFEERLAERGRIAQDLHDTLLQGFVSASMQMDVAVDSLPERSEERSKFERVHLMITRLINEGRETVQGLRTVKPMSPGFEGLFQRVREEADPERSVDLVVTINGQPRPIHPIIYDEVCHIAQEAVVNTFRHADAGRIDVTIKYSPRKFFISIKDDGKGIDPEFVKHGRDGHWGLSGMRERADKTGAQLKIWSTRGSGTEIEMTIPGRIAYMPEDDPALLRMTRKVRDYFRK